mmetsp:Transcript_8851/g.40230  ORF Transcript_8851/g.40230 Transcript_8851/m.40230 type:complete len:211 (-) Transcript_8851:241-873(-)
MSFVAPPSGSNASSSAIAMNPSISRSSRSRMAIASSRLRFASSSRASIAAMCASISASSMSSISSSGVTTGPRGSALCASTTRAARPSRYSSMVCPMLSSSATTSGGYTTLSALTISSNSSSLAPASCSTIRAVSASSDPSFSSWSLSASSSDKAAVVPPTSSSLMARILLERSPWRPSSSSIVAPVSKPWSCSDVDFRSAFRAAASSSS